MRASVGSRTVADYGPKAARGATFGGCAAAEHEDTRP
jgi:hypothetical protein